MLVYQNEMVKIYGKTGSGTNGKAWFVGFSEEDDTRKYFAIYLSDQEQASDISGNIAKEFQIRLLRFVVKQTYLSLL